jgi:hypothetical protein
MRVLLIGIFFLTPLFAKGNSSDTLQLTINALNLSEDMSTLSSKNDEVLVLIYPFVDTTKLPAPIAAEYFVLDSANRKKISRVACPPHEMPLLFFLAEIDSDKTPAQVELLFRKNFKEIINCINKKDLIALQKYIGDDDLIGFKIINKGYQTKGISFTFQGRYKLDKFLYKIDIEKISQ